MTTYRKLRVLMVFLFLPGGWNKTPAQDYTGLKMNQIQVIGTHNSYKKRMDPWVMEYLTGRSPEAAASLDYAHLPLNQQLEMGVRALEIDVFYDPEGGLYSKPFGVELQKRNGIEASGPDPEVMDRPGFKVLHVQDMDYNSHNLTLIDALQEIKEWSDGHPDHLPITISVEPKQSVVRNQPEFVTPLPFSESAFDALDGEVASVFDPDEIITPDRIRGDFETLEESALNKNWPLVDDVRGTVMFVLNAKPPQREIYLASHPSLKGRLMFVNTQPGNPECAVIYRNNPRKNYEEIKTLVKKGYLVRTRADAGTKEARAVDYSRLELAIQSGAQVISTDYIVPDSSFNSSYMVRLPGNRMENINPVNGRSIARHP